jgi:sulfoxide reductase heme-binding subunit YedZ
VDTGNHLFWITSRAAGTTALVIASISLGFGLAMSRRSRGAAGAGAGDYRAVHEALSLTALAMIALHGLALLGDGFLRPGITGIAIPGASSYRPFWTAIGIVGGYGLAVLGLTYYARARIGVSRWRRLHAFTGAFWVLGVLHSFGSGTDRWQLWFLLVAGAAVLPGVGLLLARTATRIGDALDLPRSEPPVRSAPLRAPDRSRLPAGR